MILSVHWLWPAETESVLIPVPLKDVESMPSAQQRITEECVPVLQGTGQTQILPSGANSMSAWLTLIVQQPLPAKLKNVWTHANVHEMQTVLQGTIVVFAPANLGSQEIHME